MVRERGAFEGIVGVVLLPNTIINKIDNFMFLGRWSVMQGRWGIRFVLDVQILKVNPKITLE